MKWPHAVQREEGQALLVVVLVMVVSLTIALTVVSRTITNVRTQSEAENSQKAFSAAEAGIERALRGDIASDVTLENKAKIKNVAIVAVRDGPLKKGADILKNDAVDVWLSKYPRYEPDPDAPVWSTQPAYLQIYWGNPAVVVSDCKQEAAIEIVVIEGPITAPKTRRVPYDPCDSRRSENKFTDPAKNGPFSVGGNSYKYRGSAQVQPPGLIARVVPLYAATPIAAQGSINPDGSGPIALPKQGDNIESTGTFGETSRKVTLYQGFPGVPIEFFPYTIFSHY